MNKDLAESLRSITELLKCKVLQYCNCCISLWLPRIDQGGHLPLNTNTAYPEPPPPLALVARIPPLRGATSVAWH